VTVLIVTPDAFDTTGNWSNNVIDNTFNPFILVVGVPTRSNLRDIIRDASNIPVGRIAFFAGDADIESSTIFTNLVAQLQASTFEFVAPVVPAVRSTENNRLFVASFTPNTGSGDAQAFWPGHLISFDLNPDGSIPSPVVANWDAAVRLNSRTAPRRIYTYDRNTSQRYEFNTVHTVPGSPPLVTHQMLGVTFGDRGTVVDTVRDLGLGDIFHSTPVLVGAPSRFAGDPAGLAARQTFVDTYSNRTRILVAGANDGMFHAFHAGTWIGNPTPPALPGYDAGTG
jgi:Tfp pilus tip-associated adhesin PilY1